MTNSINGRLRHALSFLAFASLLTAFSIGFASPPPKGVSLTIHKAERSHSMSPTPALRLAEAPAKASAKGELTGSLNLNTATADELTMLPGIGEKKAERIIEWRKKHGAFKRVVDLRRVKGFGAKSVRKLAPYLSVKGKSTLMRQ